MPLFISSPSHSPRKLSFFSLPNLPKVQRGLEHACSSISTVRLHSKILGAGILKAKEEILRTCEGRKGDEVSSPL